MLPKEIYRDDFDGCVFDTLEDAHEQAVYTAASNLRALLSDADHKYPADYELIEERVKDIKKAMTDLNAAFAGNKVHCYKLNSL